MSRVCEGVLRVSGDSLGGGCEGVPSLFRGTPYLPPSVPSLGIPEVSDTLTCPTCGRSATVLVPVECVGCRRGGGVESKRKGAP